MTPLTFFAALSALSAAALILRGWWPASPILEGLLLALRFGLCNAWAGACFGFAMHFFTTIKPTLITYTLGGGATFCGLCTIGAGLFVFRISPPDEPAREFTPLSAAFAAREMRVTRTTREIDA